MGSVGINLRGFGERSTRETQKNNSFGASRRGKCWLLFNLPVKWRLLGVSCGRQITGQQPGTLLPHPYSG